MIIQLVAILLAYLVIGFLVLAGVRKFDQFMIDSGHGNWVLESWGFAYIWPVLVLILLFGLPQDYREFKQARQRLAEREIEQIKREKIKSVIIIPEGPMDKRKARFEQVYSNELLTDTDQTKCYICESEGHHYDLVDTVSTARVHLQCLYEYIEV